jgi:hypothetical protein
MTELNTRSKEMGLLMNAMKISIMTISMETPIIIGGTPIQYCKEYNYLGQATGLTGKRNSKEESVSHGANSGTSNSYY